MCPFYADDWSVTGDNIVSVCVVDPEFFGPVGSGFDIDFSDCVSFT